VTTVDNTVKPVVKPELPGTAGVGAVSAPGIDAVTATGAGAVGTSAVQAVGEQAPTPVTPTTGTIPPTGGPGPAAGHGGAATGSRGQAIAGALKWLGTPYVFGGGSANGPTKSAVAHGNFNDVGFDCSGLVQYALAAAGISDSSHYSYDQLKMGQKVGLNQLKPGDLVGFGDGHHIALYAGNGQIIEAASTGTTVRQRALGPNEGAWGVSLSGLYGN